MELEQLRQLDVIARYGTLQAAADRLHISQSALSRSLKRLEDDLGQQLFDRTRNSLQINANGRLALEHAQLILAEERRKPERGGNGGERDGQDDGDSDQQPGREGFEADVLDLHVNRLKRTCYGTE